MSYQQSIFTVAQLREYGARVMRAAMLALDDARRWEQTADALACPDCAVVISLPVDKYGRRNWDAAGATHELLCPRA